MSTAPRLLDVSHVVEHGMITYKGFSAPIICDYLSREASRATYAAGTEFQIGRIDMVANTGVVMVGIDSHNIDSTDDGHRPVHSVLLRRGLPICEHMTGLAAPRR